MIIRHTSVVKLVIMTFFSAEQLFFIFEWIRADVLSLSGVTDPSGHAVRHLACLEMCVYAKHLMLVLSLTYFLWGSHSG